jgi:hypothetical protein
MKPPVVLVAVSLMLAILLSASLLIATGAGGEIALRLIGGNPESSPFPTPRAAA